jgi:hypothetical protein
VLTVHIGRVGVDGNRVIVAVFYVAAVVAAAVVAIGTATVVFLNLHLVELGPVCVAQRRNTVAFVDLWTRHTRGPGLRSLQLHHNDVIAICVVREHLVVRRRHV